MIRWEDHVTLPAMRTERHFGRTLRCFAERPPSMHAMFARAVAAGPQREAISFEGRRWSYAEAAAETDRIAGALAARGLRQGQRVGIRPADGRQAANVPAAPGR